MQTILTFEVLAFYTLFLYELLYGDFIIFVACLQYPEIQSEVENKETLISNILIKMQVIFLSVNYSNTTDNLNDAISVPNKIELKNI